MTKRIIQISCLGNFGRFGNQLFQYAFARAYAEKNNCILETPRWIGQEIFEIQDPQISRPLPRFSNNSLPPKDGRVNIDLYGYFQNIQCLNYMTRQWLQKIFKIRSHWLNKYNYNDSIIAHLRRGDYKKLSKIYCIIKKQSYIEACRQYGYNSKEMKFVSEDSPYIDGNLPSRLQFLPDFLRLMQGKILFRSNSTFSWWASTLGGMKTYSPIVIGKRGNCNVKFIEGNWPMMFDPKNNSQEPSIFTDLILKEN